MDDKRFDWTPALTTKLIDLYQANKCLWDQTDDKYKCRVKRECALQEISNYFGLTSNEIKRKIHNLRNQFNQEYNKTARLSHTGDPDDVRSRWSYYDQLKFIRSTSKPSITQTFYVNTSKSQQSIDISYADSSDDDATLANIKHEPKKRYIEIEEYVPKKVIKTQNNNVDTTNQSKIDDGSLDPLEYENTTDTVVEKYVIHQKPQSHRQSTQQQQRQTSAKKRDYDEMNSNNLTVYDTRNSTVLLETSANNDNSIQQGNRREDEYSIFGQFVSNELRSLKNPLNRKKLKRLIQKAILEVTMDEDEYE